MTYMNRGVSLEMPRRGTLRFCNPGAPLWAVVLLWPVQVAIATGCIIVAAVLFGERMLSLK